MIGHLADTLPSIDYYDDLAANLAPAYDSISFEQANSGVAPFLPANPTSVLDVGAGSGRDARALAAMGHRVVAVEPSAAFRSLATGIADRLAWIDDRLPDLPVVRAMGQDFGFILCSAVLMLIPPRDLGRCFATLGSLLTRSGRLAISVRAPAQGEPADVFHSHTDEDILAAAARRGLETIHCATPDDALGRHALTWRSFVFESVIRGRVPPPGRPPV